ncbi:MAG: FtsX-like permease family protein, partial [Rhizobacter sp.]|nr:FtsX-like permease family protein [Chlorobiales bacterium]
IVVVASLSLVGSLTMTAIEKKRELYFLHCIGLGTAALQRIFLFEGLLIASIGIALGLTLGAGICWAQQTFGLVKLYGSEAFIISAYPVTMNAADFLYVALATAIVSFIASLYPARKAAVISERLNAVAV